MLKAKPKHLKRQYDGLEELPSFLLGIAGQCGHGYSLLFGDCDSFLVIDWHGPFDAITGELGMRLVKGHTT